MSNMFAYGAFHTLFRDLQFANAVYCTFSQRKMTHNIEVK